MELGRALTWLSDQSPGWLARRSAVPDLAASDARALRGTAWNHAGDQMERPGFAAIFDPAEPSGFASRTGQGIRYATRRMSVSTSSNGLRSA
jgi:hypothetical protein